MKTTVVKTDLSKLNKTYYSAKKVPSIHNFGALDYITLSGVGAPEHALFTNSISSLYTVAYTIKAICKTTDQDFKVPKLEAFWWVESGKEFMETPREEWHWKLLIQMPAYVDASIFEESVDKSFKKKKVALINEVCFEEINEGKCVQALHLGSYDHEDETIKEIFLFMEDEGLKINGYHHEIYISDPMKTPQERLKTIIRYGVN